MVVNLDVIKGFFSNSLSGLGNIKWVIFIILGLAILFVIIYIVSSANKLKKQWTHTLILRRELENGKVSSPEKIKMKRYVDDEGKVTSYFLLAKPVMGCRLIADLGEYSGINEYSVILNKANRVFLNKGDYFRPSEDSCYVSGRHAEIDIQFENMRNTVKLVNSSDKKLNWKSIAKFALFALLIIGAVIVAIVALNKWSEIKALEAEKEIAMADTMNSLQEIMETVQSTVLIQQMEIRYMLTKLYGTENIPIPQYNITELTN
jgi:uncharacterized protein YpmS